MQQYLLTAQTLAQVHATRGHAALQQRTISLMECSPAPPP
jgi:hypothetical protein